MHSNFNQMSQRFWDNYPGPTLKHYITSFFRSSPPTIIPVAPLKKYTDTIYIENNTYTYNEYTLTDALPIDVTVAIKTAFNLYTVPRPTILLTLRDSTGSLVGIIAAKLYGKVRRNYLEDPMKEPLHYIDYFWTAPQCRGRGLGNFLLNAIFRYLVHTNGTAPVIFIKEGTPLKKIIPPLYSSHYICTQDHIHSRQDHIHSRQDAVFVTQDAARRIAAKWLGSSTGQLQAEQAGVAGQYVLCDKALYYITNPHQLGPDKKPIAWITGAVFSPLIKNYTASLNICAAFLKSQLNIGYVWADIQYLNKELIPPQWKIDGPFHIYAFQWDPGAFQIPLNGCFSDTIFNIH
jgi:GNAT superfamily N-acetyltransferase